MTKEQLEKANSIHRNIRKCIENIEKAEQAMKTDSLKLEINIDKFRSLHSLYLISIPESLSEVILKLVMNEHKIELIRLEKELSEL